jgi:threonyl-tRNA synthetase
MIRVTVRGHGEMELEEGSCAQDVAMQLKLTGPDQALAASINKTTRDLSHPLKDGDHLILWSFSDPEGQEVFWHSSAHLLAQAVLRLWPEAKPTIGPPIENGFYYDFANLTVSEEDFAQIEKEMKAIVKENHKSIREEIPSKRAALEAFSNNKYKVELIKELDDKAQITAYRQGEFYDLCRGPHLPNVGKVKALKVLKTSGAYWRGDSKKEMLTRVYAITFPSRDLLQDYLHKLEEAKKRDHKVLGPRLDLYSIHPEAPGMPFIHPKGHFIWQRLLEYMRDLHDQAGYVEIKTPVMMSRELWELSGHWANYRDNMYVSEVEERDYAIKPMNCPGCMLYFRQGIHSYRELPLRVAEFGHVHRYEPSGALSGLFRVRGFHQDDAHIFMRPDDLQQEIINVLQLADRLYSTFGLHYHLELSTQPEEKTIGTDAEWEFATHALRQAMVETEREFTVNEGDGAFYGPKIDFHIRDALGRSWQCGTIQLDMALPQRFDLEYTDSDGQHKRPIMIHRAIYGSLERFLGSLIEFYAGKFPLWLSPRQIRILTVAERHSGYAQQLASRFREAGFQVEVDSTNESVGKKVRNAQMLQVNYMLTVGDQEVDHKTAALRTRDNVVHGELDIEQFLAKISEEKASRSLTSPFSTG